MKISSNAIKAVKQAWTDHFASELTLEEVRTVLKLFPDNYKDHDIADYLGVHVTTIGKWRNGKKTPTGDNSIAFRSLLFAHELKEPVPASKRNRSKSKNIKKDVWGNTYKKVVAGEKRRPRLRKEKKIEDLFKDSFKMSSKEI